MNFEPIEQKYGLPKGILNAVMTAESGGDVNAVSPKGALGPFQFMPATAREMGVQDVNDIGQAAEGAAKYLRQNLDKFGDVNLALAAYNAGPGNVEKYGGIPPFKETQNYVKTVTSLIPDIQGQAGKDVMRGQGELPEGFVLDQPDAEQPQESGGFLEGMETFGKSIPRGLTLGASDEMGKLLQAGIFKLRGAENPWQKAEELRKRRVDNLEGLQDRNKAAGFAGEMTGAIAGAYGLGGTRLGQAGAKLAQSRPYLGAAGAYAVSGGLYSAGTGEGNLAQRAQDGVAGGVAGAIIGPLGAAVGRRLGPLAQKAQNKYLKKKSVPVAQTARDLIDPKEAARLKQGEILPMSQGQFTQDPRLQSLENMARKRAVGDNAADLMMRADKIQNQAIRGVAKDIAGELPEDTTQTLTGAGKMAQGAYRDIKGQVSSAYDDARIMKNVYVNKTPISEQFAPKVKGILRDGGFDVSDMSDKSQKLINDVTKNPAFKNEKITSMNLDNMEFWRKKVTNAISDNTDSFGNLSPEGVALKQVRDEYDRFMAKLPEDALKSGDESALQAINKARALRRKQGVLFERDKVVEKIVKGSSPNNPLTDEELANMVLTGSARSEKIHSGSGRIVKNLKRAVGDKSPEMQEALKRGTVGRMLKRSTGTITEGNSTTRMLEPGKLRKELDALMENKSFLKEVFEPEEIKKLEALHRDIIKIGSEQKGTNNYSNTAYTLMQALQSLPLGLSGASALTTPSLKAIGDRSAQKTLKKSLGPALEDVIDELSSKQRFFGAAATAPASGRIVDELGITVRPSDSPETVENYNNLPYMPPPEGYVLD